MTSITTTFAAAVKAVDNDGDYFATGLAEMLAPRLEIEGAGPIALPLLPVQAEQLIAVAERAPYGRGEETLTDIDVRRTWQIGPDRIHIGGKHWLSTLGAILERVAEGLGVTGLVEAELYKMLIYDQGSFFVRHRDTEKSPSMFATLILVLPSVSSGGELIVRHKGREERLDLSCEDPSEIAFAAFYADCVHEVLPVTAGYRACLVYNLVRHGGGRLPRPPDHTAEQDRVTRLLKTWAEDLRDAENVEPDKLVFPLEHAYTQAELGFDALKGADAGIASVVTEAAQRADCELHLALITIEERGTAEYSGDYGRRRSWSRSDDDDDDDEFEAGEVDERAVTLEHWCRPAGEPSLLIGIPVKAEEISPPEALDDLDPDEEHFHEATGNAGASFERTYRRAALVLWPRGRLLSIINQGGLSVTMPLLTDLVSRASQDTSSWRQAHELAGHMIDTWPTANWYPQRDNAVTSAGKMLELLVRLKDTDHLDRFLADIAARGALDRGDTKAVADGLRLLPPDRAASLVHQVIAAASGRSLAACTSLLADAATLGATVLTGAATEAVAALPTSESRDQWGRGVNVEPDLVTALFIALPRIDAGLADRAANHMLASPALYGFDLILIPALKDIAPFASPAVDRLRQACVAHLSNRIAEALEPPRDWRRPGQLKCNCARCKEVSQFLADPDRPRWMLKAVEAERGHVEASIRNSQCDLDTATETKKRPYTLICTKNQASYERRCVQRQADLADLERLKG